jgi:hypothetical protein
MPIVAKSVTEFTTIQIPQPVVEEQRVLDTFVITSITIGLPPNDVASTRINGKIERGYRNDKNEFVAVGDPASFEIRGAELLGLMGDKVTPGLSHYEDFKATIYNFLIARGDILAGDVV